MKFNYITDYKLLSHDKTKEKRHNCCYIFFCEGSDVMFKGTDGTYAEHRNIIMLHTALYTQTTEKPNVTVTHNRRGVERRK